MPTSFPRTRLHLVVLTLGLGACGSEPVVSSSLRCGGLASDATAITEQVNGTAILELIDDASIADAEVRARIATLRQKSWAAAVRVGRLVPRADSLLTAGRAVAFDVNEDRRLVFTGASRVVNAGASISWTGTLRGGRRGQANVVLTEIGLTATLQVLPPDGAVYSIQPLGGGYEAIIYVDPCGFPPD